MVAHGCGRLRLPRTGGFRGSEVFPNPPCRTAGFIFPSVSGSSGEKGTMEKPISAHPSKTLVLLAFAVIYIVWGSTYLAIRVVVETMPPFLSAAARFLVAGVALMAFLVWRGMPLPAKGQWKHFAVTG